MINLERPNSKPERKIVWFSIEYAQNLVAMCLVAHWFGRVKFRILNIYFDFFKCTCLKKTTTNIWNSTRPKSMSYQGHLSRNLVNIIYVEESTRHLSDPGTVVESYKISGLKRQIIKCKNWMVIEFWKKYWQSLIKFL